MKQGRPCPPPPAAAVPLKLAPMLYGKVVTAAQLDAEVFHNLRLFLEKSAQPLQVFTCLSA